MQQTLFQWALKREPLLQLIPYISQHMSSVHINQMISSMLHFV